MKILETRDGDLQDIQQTWRRTSGYVNRSRLDGRYGSTFEDRWLYLKLFSIDIRVILKVKSVRVYDWA
jgi:hypothetical protein